ARGMATAPEAPDAEGVPSAWCEALGALVADASLDPAFRALALELPGNDEIAADIVAQGGEADPDRIHAAITAMRQALGRSLDATLSTLYAEMRPTGPYSPDADSAGRRALAMRALAPLVATGSATHVARAEALFDEATNMTESIGALGLLVHHGAPGAGDRLDRFEDRWQGDELVMDKWFSVQATAPGAQAAARVAALTGHPAFAWQRPNRFRAVVATFAMGNPTGFHAADGAGYRFVADWILKLDAVNPQTAARVSGAFESWKRYDAKRRDLIHAEMARIAASETLSRNTREIVERMLSG
ncbi:MAG: aminopeptidase N C-terminal domain-containing protein, partial [Pseudomonadota bacterium]